MRLIQFSSSLWLVEQVQRAQRLVVRARQAVLRGVGAKRCKVAVLGLLFGISSSTALATAIGFTISPSVFTNNYVGRIAFSITNLTPGMTVTVDEFADVNSNGVIDAADLAIGSFQLTDGRVQSVSGVRNLNVPGDDDGLANGQILTLYDYPDVGGAIYNGNFLFRVSDPAGSLTSATQAVSVVQYVYPQGITGRVTLYGTGAPLTNCPLVLVNYGSESRVALTDTNGNYRFYGLPPGYVVGGFNQRGAVFNFNQIAFFSCGQMLTNNLVITNGHVGIIGRVTDNATGAGIPNLQLDANTADNLDAAGYTDTNGNYQINVTSNTWRLHPSTAATAARGYVDQTRTSVLVTNANVFGINFALSKPTALIYGTIKDTLGNPVLGIAVSTRDSANSFHPVGRSFAPDGSYSLGVQADTWNNIALDSTDLAAQGLTSANAYNVTLVAGQTTNINFVATRTVFPSLTNPVHVSSNQFQFLLNGLGGQPYMIQTTTNLGDSNWLALLTTNVPCSSVFILDSHATNGQRFYRALIVP